jgi:hypothetical protein
VSDANVKVAGVHNGWRQMQRVNFDIVRYTVEALMRDLGLAGEIRGKPVRSRSNDPMDRLKARNALAKMINGFYKAEVIDRRGPWRSFEAVVFATREPVDRFNNRRLLDQIGNIPPAEAEQRDYATADDVPITT